MYTMYVNIIQIIPLIMLMLGHTRYEESPPKKERKKERRDGAKPQGVHYSLKPSITCVHDPC